MLIARPTVRQSPEARSRVGHGIKGRAGLAAGGRSRAGARAFAAAVCIGTISRVTSTSLGIAILMGGTSA
jgi:hypothetical protein